MRTLNLTILLALLALLCVPAMATAAPPEDEEGSDDDDDDDARDGASQAQPPKLLLDPRRSPGVERRAGAKMASDRKAAAAGADGDKDRKEKAGDDGDDDDDDAEDKGLAGQDEPVPGGGSGQWSTTSSADRKALSRPPRDTLVNIDFVDADLKDVVKYFAEVTGRNFVIADSLKGKITIISPTPVTIAEAYEAFLSALDASGFSTVTEGRLIRIVASRQSIKEPIETYFGDYLPTTANMVTRIVRLENVGVEDLSKIASKMVGDGGDVTSYAPTNSLIITDSANNIRRIEELLKELDVSAPTQQLEVIQIEWADAVDIVEKIREIFGVDDQQAAASTQQEDARTRRASSRRSRRNKKKETPTPAAATSDQIGSGSYIGKIMADERTNSIIIMATEQALEDVKEFIADVDYEIDPWAKSDIHVVYLEHAKADELAQVLSNLTQEANQRAQQQQTRAGRTRASASQGDKGGSGSSGSAVAQFEGGVKVTADIATNSLVVTASRDDFRRLKRVIDMLDIRRKQVFVEAIIMEVNDELERDTGIGFHTGYAKDSLGKSGIGAAGLGSVGGGSLMQALAGDTGLSLDLSGLAMGLFGSSIPVAIGSTSLDIPAFGVVITALENDVNTEVLSAPNLLTLDNEEAEIIVGQTIPFSAGFTTTTQGLPISNFTREDVALTLRVTPQISESDIVTLQVFQEITEVVPETQGTDLLSSGGVTTTKRSVETVVSVRNNQTIVLGGLMQTNETLSEDKVPLLGDIPLLGALFRSTKKTDRKTNLLLFLTPHVIDTPEDLQEIYTIKMLQRQEFLRRFYGKSMAEQRKEMDELLQYSMNLQDRPSVYRDRQSAPRYDSTDLEEMYDDAPGPGGHSEYHFRARPEDEEPVDDGVYDDGYDEGYDDAYDEAYDDAYDEAYDDAYDEGYDDARDDADEEDDDEDEEKDEEDAAPAPSPAERYGGYGAPLDVDYEVVVPRPGELLITPGGGEFRYPPEPVEEE